MGAGLLVLLYVGLLWALPAYVAERIGEGKQRPGLVWWGICLGWAGVAVAACMADGVGRDAGRCPHCLSLIPRQATRCRYCAGAVTPLPPDR